MILRWCVLRWGCKMIRQMSELPLLFAVVNDDVGEIKEYFMKHPSIIQKYWNKPIRIEFYKPKDKKIKNIPKDLKDKFIKYFIGVFLSRNEEEFCENYIRYCDAKEELRGLVCDSKIINIEEEKICSTCQEKIGEETYVKISEPALPTRYYHLHCYNEEV